MVLLRPLTVLILITFCVLLWIEVCEASTFRMLDSGFPPGSEVADVHFNSSSSGILASGTTIKKSLDGGATWTTASASPPGSRINDLFSTSQTNLWASTNLGLYQSINGGLSWAGRMTPGEVFKMNWVSPTESFCATTAGIFRSANSGLNWSQVAPVAVHSISMWNPSAGFASGDWWVYYTTDGWHSYTTSCPALMTIRTLQATGTESASIGGFAYYYDADYDINYYTSTVGRTGDGGSSWNTTWMSDTGVNTVFSVEDIRSTGAKIFAVGRFRYLGDEGWVLASENGGLSWVPFFVPLSGGWILRSASFPTGSLGWLCGEGPSLLGPYEKPFVRIDEPAQGQMVGCSVPVKGTVSDSDLENWTLEVGSRDNPPSFQTVSTGFGLKFRGDLGVWNAEPYPEGTYTLKLTARNKEGYTASFTRGIFLDGTPPTVSISRPVDGEDIWGNSSVIANATDYGLGVKNVKFSIDGNLKYTDSSSPYRYDFNTKDYQNGRHSIKVIAEDRGGRVNEKTIEVEISNGLFTDVNPITISFSEGTPGQAVGNDACVIKVKNHIQTTASLYLRVLSEGFSAADLARGGRIPASAGSHSTLPTVGAAIVAGQRSFTTAFATIAFDIPPNSTVNLAQRYFITYPLSCLKGDYFLSASYQSYPEPTIFNKGTFNKGDPVEIAGSASCPDFSFYKLEFITDSKEVIVRPDNFSGTDTFIEENSNISYGQFNYMIVKDDDLWTRKYSLIKFPLDSLPVAANIYKSFMGLTPEYNYGADKYWYQMTRNWSEASSWISIDADSLWPFYGKNYGLLYQGMKGDLTALTDLWYKQPSANFGVYIRGSESNGEAKYYTCESSMITSRPFLKIAYGDEIYETKTIYTSSQSVIEGALGTWDTSNLSPGPYILKLSVFDKNGFAKVVKKSIYINERI